MFYDLSSKGNCESSNFWKNGFVELLCCRVKLVVSQRCFKTTLCQKKNFFEQSFYTGSTVLIMVYSDILIPFNRKKSLADKQVLQSFLHVSLLVLKMFQRNFKGIRESWFLLSKAVKSYLNFFSPKTRCVVVMFKVQHTQDEYLECAEVKLSSPSLYASMQTCNMKIFS